MNKCPCEKCISFAICNSIMKKIMDVTHLSIERNCSAISKYIKEEDPTSYYKKVNIARKLYKLPPIRRGNTRF
jgi:hypothetical protein